MYELSGAKGILIFLVFAAFGREIEIETPPLKMYMAAYLKLKKQSQLSFLFASQAKELKLKIFLTNKEKFEEGICILELI